MKKLVKDLNIQNNMYESVFDGTDIQYALLSGYTWEEIEKGLDHNYYIPGFEPNLSFEELQNIKLQEINTRYSIEATLVKKDIPEEEVLSWDIQRLEAKSYRLNAQEPTPFLDILASTRNVDKDWLVEKVLEKVQIYEQIIGYLTGKRQKYEDMIKLAKTEDDLNLIVWENSNVSIF